MKRNIFRLMTLCTVAVLALASCKKENQPQNNAPENGFLATIEANQGNGSRTHLVGTEVQWNAGDQIVVRNGNGDVATYSLTDGENTMEGTFYSSEDANDFFQPSYTAIYPAAEGNTVTGEGAATFTLPATQSYVANSFANGAMPMMAVSDEQTLAFKNALGGICFPMTGSQTVTRLVLTSNSATDHLSGVFSADYNNGQPTLTYTSGGANSITLDCGAGVTLDATTATDFTIMVPAGTLANGFKLEAYNGESMVFEKTNDAALGADFITRSVIKKVNSNLEVVVFSDGFSVSPTQIVYFSPGNLQWSATGGGTTATTHAVAGGGTAPGTWRFAEYPWDYIGNAAGNTTAAASRETQAAWIDFFGWGTSGYDNTANDPYAIRFQPWASSTSMVNNTYNTYGYGPSYDMPGIEPNLVGTSANYDWGVYNAIYNPKTNTTDAAGIWRTPTYFEWEYIINTRTTCCGVRYAKATVNNVAGLIIVPDNWDVNTYALNGTNTPNAEFTVNTISSTDWTNIFEPAGCAFLPASGIREGTSVTYAGSFGNYWSAKSNGQGGAVGQDFSRIRVFPSSVYGRNWGRSVRLVKDAQ